MIILFHPRAVKPRNRRLPLAVLALAAVLEGAKSMRLSTATWTTIPRAILHLIDHHDVELLGVSVHARPADGRGHGGMPRSAPPASASAASFGADTSLPSTRKPRSMRNTSTSPFAGRAKTRCWNCSSASRPAHFRLHSRPPYKDSSASIAPIPSGR